MTAVHQVLAAAVKAVGGDERPGQLAMAEAVAESFRSGRHLLVQAGTGTGKSLGYLAPSLLHGDRVVIATATLNLQHQLIERDIPALIAGAGATLDRSPSYAVVKGRANYACLHRVREGAPDDQGVLVDVPEGSLGAEVVALREWAERQVEADGSGDRDAAPSHTDRSWRQVSVSARECLGASRCPYASECFAERARDEAQDAQLIVTNHAMLAIDTIERLPMLPEFSAVVIDEAHELIAKVTQASTAELDPAGVERAARRARRHVDEAKAVDDLADAADSLAEVLTTTPPGRIDESSRSLRAGLELVRDAARACFSAFGSAQQAEDADPARQQARSAVDEIRQIAERMAAERETEVLWLGEQRSGMQLKIAPIDVSGALRDHLFAHHTVVLTSATLTLGGSFDPIAASLGLTDESSVSDDADAAPSRWRGLDVGSPFDYGRQGILYVAAHLPPPGRDGLTTDQLGEITALVKSAGGRALGLFSSRRGAERAAEYVRTALPETEILCQGDAQLPELARRFSESPETCLFGTLSLWQGIDLPGETCTLVIIDRIPFPRPDDPLMSARQRLVERRGGNGFMQVAAQHAALLLAQGAGRLIRRLDDRGVVAILDPRIVTARYGRFLAASLPPLWRTADRAVVMGALSRLDARARQAGVR